MCRIGSRVNFVFFSPSFLRKEETCCEWREMQSANVPWYIYRDPLCATDIPRALHNPNGMCWPHKTGTIYFSSMRPSSSSLTLIVIWFHFPLLFFFIKISMGLFVGQKNHFVVIKSCGLTCNRHIVWRHQIVLMFSRSRYLDGVFFLCDWISWIRLRRLGKPWKSCRRGKE